MTTVPTPRTSPAEGGLSEQDLAEVLAAFNDVTGKLHATHEALRSEVARLKSELRDANEQVERSRRLAAMGEMAAGISHEVRNPLGSIKLYARMLEQDLLDRPEQRRIAEKISGAVRGLDAIVGDVLAFAREMPIRRAEVGVRELLERAVDEACASSDATLATATTPTVRINASGRLECDAALVHRAVVNVLRNAIEAFAEHRTQSPHLEICFLECIAASDLSDEPLGDDQWSNARDTPPLLRATPMLGATKHHVMRVVDNGPGIPEEVLPRIFNPFFTTRASGTGLGLAIVHRIMEGHGGRVSVQNQTVPSRGATVELWFPAKSARTFERAERARTDTHAGLVSTTPVCDRHSRADSPVAVDG
jgi:signal transduction histidine kinase